MEDNNVGTVLPVEAPASPRQDPPTKFLAVPTTPDEPVADGQTLEYGEGPPQQTTTIDIKIDTIPSREEAFARCHDEGGAHESMSEGEDQSEEEEEEEGSEEDVNDAEIDDLDDHTETCIHEESEHRSVDIEVERHEVNTNIPETEMPPSAMAQASKTALFRRYSRMTPTAMEEQERSFHENAFQEVPSLKRHHSFCPEPTTQTCQDPACEDQLRWRDARIAELQAALDHMTEAMAIQQRDMASQRVFLSRQAEQLTNLSNKLHRDRVALHVERERFQQTVASTPPIMAIASKLKPAAGKIKSPVKKLFSAASGRRATFTTINHNSATAMTLQSSPLVAPCRSSSSSQLRRNPLISDSSPITNPIQDRSSSLSVLDLRPAHEQSVIAITPPKDDMTRLVDVKLNDGLSPTKTTYTPAPVPATATVAPTPLDLDTLRRGDRVDSSADLASEQKKQSLGDRLRSIRWGRS